ncbi:MAG: hypothetical protein AABZ53_13575 [Planctomycetota bacterium]|mgnify:CR=1 FL=1
MPSPQPLSSTRWRRRIGLTLLAAGVALTLLMGASVKWWFGYSTLSWIADVGDGTLYVQKLSSNSWNRSLTGWCGGVNVSHDKGPEQSWTWTWWAWGSRRSAWEGGTAYSVWPLAPVLLVTGVVLFRPSHRMVTRARNNQCLGCGYSRAGITPEVPCPECGMGPNYPGAS